MPRPARFSLILQKAISLPSYSSLAYSILHLIARIGGRIQRRGNTQRPELYGCINQALLLPTGPINCILMKYPVLRYSHWRKSSSPAMPKQFQEMAEPLFACALYRSLITVSIPQQNRKLPLQEGTFDAVNYVIYDATT